MSSRQSWDERAAGAPPRHSPEETARLGDAIYERTIRARVEREHDGEVVAVDIDGGAYAVAEDALTAARRLRAHHPNAEVWFVRVGSRTLDRIGARDSLGGP
jgi:hypothetical protein